MHFPQVPPTAQSKTRIYSTAGRRLPSKLAAISFVLFCIAWTNQAAAQCRGPIFSNAPEFAAGEELSSVASADFNSDSKLDLAITDESADRVSILLGDGVGGFAPPTSFPVAQAPFSIAVGDFNKDNKADVAVGHFFGGGPVSVLFGDGTGGLSAPLIINIPGHHRVAVGDFNADTNPDIAVGTFQGNPTILLGDGTGNFSMRQVTVGDDTRELVTGEFNGDGITDLAFATDSIPDKVTIVLGNSGGVFVAGTVVPLDQSPLALAAPDINDDGRADLAVAVQHFEPRLMFFINDGSGSFSAPSHFLINDNAVSLVSADFNNDSKDDLALANASGSTVQVFMATNEGSLTSGFVRFLTGNLVRSIAVGDVNVDGKVDLISANAGGGLTSTTGQGNVSVMLGDGAGAFAAVRGFWSPGLNPMAVAVGDFNNNGRSDLAVGVANQPLVAIMLDDGTGGLLPAQIIVAQNAPHSLAVGDFNADSNRDLVTANLFSNTLSVFLGNGAGGFVLTNVLQAGTNPSLVVTGKFNSDNRDDIAVRFTSGIVSILLSNNSGGFDVAPGSPFTAGAFTLVAGDYNGDAVSDLVIGKTTDNTLSILLNNGTGLLTTASTIPFPAFAANPHRFAAADFNNDGDTDLAVGGTRLVTIFLGNGTGGLNSGTAFSSSSSSSSLIEMRGMDVADFDGDNNPDLAVANAETFLFSGDLTVLFGDGSGAFGPGVGHAAGGAATALGIGDFNGDLKPDVAVANAHSQTISVLRNTFVSLPCLSVNDATVTEGDSGTINANFTVSLTPASSQTVRVNFSIVESSATAGVDFVSNSQRLVFAPGDVTKTVTVVVNGDVLDETDDTFRLILASPSNAGIGDGEGLGTILDNDPEPTMSINDITVTEGGASLQWNFTVTLSAVSGREVSVQFATANGSATAGTQFNGDDYSATSGTLVIPAGQLSGTIGVFVFGDNKFEPDENFFVNLTNPSNASLIDGQGQATIPNDDPVPTLTLNSALVTEGNTGTQNASFLVSLSNPTFQTITLNFATADDTATAPADYVATSGSSSIPPGQTFQSILVPVNGDTIDEVTERFFLDISNVQHATADNTRANGVIIDNDGPSATINDVTVTEGNAGAGNDLATFTVTLSSASVEIVRVRVSTQSGTALAQSDYTPINLELTFQPGVTTRSFNVNITPDANVEPDETFFVNVTQPVACTIADPQALGTIVNDDVTFQFTGAQTTVSESANGVNLTVTRVGATSSAMMINYATSDTAGLSNCNVVSGIASSRCDYTASVGRLIFAAGETSKTLTIPIIDDSHVEGAETLTVTLSSLNNATLGVPNTATVTINDNDAVSGPNPIDQAQFFVRQHYLDFLNREPDAAGLAFWTNEITSCGSDAQCIEIKRINVSAAFFLSIEFQETGFLVYRFYKAAYGDTTSPNVAIPVPIIRLHEFLPDTQRIGEGVRVGIGNWEAQLEANKNAYALEFVNRPRFLTAYPFTMTPAEFVDKLNANAGGVLSPVERDQLIAALSIPGDVTLARANVVRRVAEDADLRQRETNRAFVLMQYYGYLRRNPDDPQDTDFRGWAFWLNKLDQFNGNFINAEMVKAFTVSIEYRQRFGP